MNKEFQFQLHTNRILNIPLHLYGDDFSFIVNGEEFKTSKLVADILSPRIFEQHQIDPTMNEFVITTKHPGNFQYILDLVKFTNLSIPENELFFFSEVCKILNNPLIKITNDNEDQNITEENVLQYLRKHEKCQVIYESKISEEIDFISSHFFTFCENHQEELRLLNENTLYQIISSNKLNLKDEDQLVEFLNKLYLESFDDIQRKDMIKNMYEFVLFQNVESKTIEEFVNVYDYNDLTKEMWNSIINRLKHPMVIQKTKESFSNRYMKPIQQSQLQSQEKVFAPHNDHIFNGILQYLRSQSNGNIENKVNITASSFYSSCVPSNVTIYDNKMKWFRTFSSQSNNWICFDFKDKKVIPTDYQITSIPFNENYNHPKSWILEGSNDNSHWERLDRQIDCAYLNGKCITHLFSIENSQSKEFRFIRMRLAGQNWYGYHYLMIGSFEIYGHLI